MTTDDRPFSEVVDAGLRAAAGALADVLSQCDPAGARSRVARSFPADDRRVPYRIGRHKYRH